MQNENPEELTFENDADDVNERRGRVFSRFSSRDASIRGRAYSASVESSQTRLAGRNSVVTELHVGNVSRASSTVTVASQRGRVKGIEDDRRGMGDEGKKVARY